MARAESRSSRRLHAVVSHGSLSLVEARAVFKAAAIALLSPEKDPKSFLLELVAWLDHRLSVTPPESLEHQLFVRAVIAQGRLLEHDLESGIGDTMAKARAYAAEPTETRYGDLLGAATMSYPFGPGDGCLAVQELGSCRDLGSGCRSGSGTLVSMVYPFGYEACARLVREDLTAWLATLP